MEAIELVLVRVPPRQSLRLLQLQVELLPLRLLLPRQHAQLLTNRVGLIF